MCRIIFFFIFLFSQANAISNQEKETINHFLADAPDHVRITLRDEMYQGLLGYFEPRLFETRDLNQDEKNFLKGKIDELHTLPLTHICLLDMGLKNVPKDIFTSPYLNALVLTENEIEELPKNIDQARSLKLLAIAENLLTNIPEALGTLPHLCYLDVGNNNLQNLPNSLAIHNLTSREIYAEENLIIEENLNRMMRAAAIKTNLWQLYKNRTKKVILVRQPAMYKKKKIFCTDGTIKKIKMIKVPERYFNVTLKVEPFPQPRTILHIN